jgi:capsular exopolysaccharide synthesis family protein
MHPQPASHPAEDLIDFARIYHLILDKLWLIASITVVLLVLVAAVVLRMPKLYTARAVIEVEQSERNVVAVRDVTQEDLLSDDFISTVMQAITSRPVLVRVINSQNLTEAEDFPPDRKPGRKYAAENLAPVLYDRIEIKQRKGTRIVDISVDDTNPERARDIARDLVQQFFRESIQQKLAVSRVTNTFLTEEAERLKEKLEQSERALQDYRATHNAISLEDRQNIIVEKLKELNTTATAAKSLRIKLEADLEQLQKTDPRNIEQMLAIGSVAELPQVARIRDQLVNADAELAALSERYLPKHPRYIAAKTKIDTLRESLREATSKVGEILQQQYEAAKVSEQKAEAALKEQETVAMKLNETAIPYGVLQREVESDRALYESVIKRVRETGVLQGAEQVPFKILEDPVVPSKPSKPKTLLILAIAAFLGIVLSTGIIVGLDLLDSSLRTVDDAERELGLPALAAIPDLEKLRHRIVDELKTSVKEGRLPDHRAITRSESVQEVHPIVLVTAPNSPPAEAFRTFRAAVGLLGPGRERRAFLFTSAVPAEGKSFTSLNSAVAFAQMGLKTVIVDADLRRPKIHEDLLHVEKSPEGLSDVLSENARLDLVTRQTDIPNLSLIPAGTRCPNPAELLTNANFKDLVENLLTRFDRVVIDTAPINAVSDTLLITSFVHCVVLVVRAGGPPRKAVRRAVQLLAKSNAHLVGFVMNRMPSGRGSGYYYYYYGGDYSKDGVYGSDKQQPTGVR